MAVLISRKSGSTGGGGGGAPTGPAGGDLSGTYPNPALSAAKQAELDAKVPKSLYDANTVLAANADDTPLALTMGASTILARLAAGNIKAATPAELRTLLTVEPYGRTTFSNANVVIAATDVLVAQTGTMSASRTATLPAASAVPAGWEVIVADASGTVTSTNTIVVTRAGADTINGSTTATIATAYGWRRLVSDGVSGWTFDGGVLRSSNNLSDLQSAATALTNLGVSSFIQTLLDDTTAAAARTTLGVLNPITRSYTSGAYKMTPPATPPADGTFAPTKDTVYYTPFPVYDAYSIDRISLGVAVAGGATSVVRLGIYTTGSNGKPSALVQDFGATIDGTSATFQEMTISPALALTANTLYWIATCWQVGTVGSGSVRATGLGAGAEWIMLSTNAVDPRTCNYTQAGVTGAFAGATPAAGTTGCPATKVRIV